MFGGTVILVYKSEKIQRIHGVARNKEQNYFFPYLCEQYFFSFLSVKIKKWNGC